MYDLRQNKNSSISWRWNREPKFLGIPGYAYLPLLSTIYIRSMTYLYIVCSLIILYAVLAKMGLSIRTLIERCQHMLRGNIIKARPFWYRKRFEGKR
ncbi:IcmT/TraK family protein [Xenorhabdus nematophila]|uniref:IcmT/TraK family protein n=1 Tax=Xenorhabdus nematophila TaxID=628 RepID=UPI003D6EDFC0